MAHAMFALQVQVYELGASIIHAQNQHVLTLAKVHIRTS
jgi:hypothetical protein